MSLWDGSSFSGAPLHQDANIIASDRLKVSREWWFRYPGDDGGDLTLPATGAGGGTGVVISTARAFGFVMGCLFMAVLVLA